MGKSAVALMCGICDGSGGLHVMKNNVMQAISNSLSMLH